MRRAYFQYYETFEVVVQKFKTSEERDAMRSKIISYGLFGIEPESLTDREEMVWDVIKDLIDDQMYRREVNTANGKGRKRTEKKPAVKTESDFEETGNKTDGNASDEIEETESDFIEESEEKSRFEEKANENEKSETENRLATESEIKSRLAKKANVSEIKSRLANESEEKSRFAEMNRNEMNWNELKRNEMECVSAPDKPDAHAHTRKFQKPALSEVQDYCSERNNGINAERFVDYYEAKGWKIGNSPMKDWKAAVRTWEQKNETPHYSPPQRTLPDDRLTF